MHAAPLWMAVPGRTKVRCRGLVVDRALLPRGICACPTVARVAGQLPAGSPVPWHARTQLVDKPVHRPELRGLLLSGGDGRRWFRRVVNGPGLLLQWPATTHLPSVLERPRILCGGIESVGAGLELACQREGNGRQLIHTVQRRFCECGVGTGELVYQVLPDPPLFPHGSDAC